MKTNIELPKGIRKNKGTYEARKMVNGVNIFLCNKDLNQLMKDFEEAIKLAKSDIDYRKNRLTLNEWFEEWFTLTKARQVKETSIYPMKSRFIKTFGFYIGELKVKDIRLMDIQGAVNAMHDNGVAVSTIRDVVGRLHECLDFAVANRMISFNPCISITVPWEYKSCTEEVALTEDEQNCVLQEVEGSWYKELFYFMFLTGVRVGELGALKWDDINFDKEVIHIRTSLSCAYHDGIKTMQIVTPKTATSTRDIPFMGEMREILLSQKEKVDRLKKELGHRWRGEGEFVDLVFVTGMGSPCTRYIVEKEVKKVIKRINEEEARKAVKEGGTPKTMVNFHPHSIRHTFATRCAERGIDPKVTQKLMGHKNISMTLNVYTHVNEKMKLMQIEKFGNALTTQEYKSPNLGVEIPKITEKSFY